MSHTTELIDLLKAKRNVDSDYAIAKLIGIHPNRISNYRRGESHADDKMAVMLADALDLDRLKTIALINSERAKDSADKKFWKNIANAAVLIMCTLPIASIFAAGSALTSWYSGGMYIM